MAEYQRVIAEINLDNIANNLREVRKAVGEKIKILAVVKADADGHGAVEVSKVALYNGADWLGVATCEEGVQLRRHSIFVPVLLLGYTPEARIDEVILNELTQTVFSYDMALEFSKAARKLNKTADIHIKIDTGMGRIGFNPTDESLEVIEKISRLQNINITGIYTHFATADEEDKTFTFAQYEKFIYMAENTERILGHKIIKHTANSGAILDLPELCLDMVREGIILYGLYPSDKVKKSLSVLPCMSLKTNVSYVKEVEAGVSIGYGRTFFTKRKSKIATVPVGYADGYSRALSNKAKVIINGTSVPVVGNVCMDQFMVDVTDAGDVKAGDTVILMGEDNGEVISADDIARIENTISYEVLCGVGKRVPRIYIKNGETIKTVNYIN